MGNNIIRLGVDAYSFILQVVGDKAPYVADLVFVGSKDQINDTSAHFSFIHDISLLSVRPTKEHPHRPQKGQAPHQSVQ